VPARGTRPTSDRVREAIASVLESRRALQDASVLELYCGTGALGLEALSRGARSLLVIDGDPAALRCARENAVALGLDTEVRALRLDLTKGSAKAVAAKIGQACTEPYSLVLADPPYTLSASVVPLLEALWAAGSIAEGALVLVEHAHKAPLSRPSGFSLLGSYRYGDTGVSLFRAEPAAPGPA